MAGTTELTRGMIIEFNKEPHILIEKEFYSPGKGGAFNRVRLKSIKTGKIFNHVFRSGEKVEELDIESKTMQYSYIEGSSAVFMDPETYDMVNVSLDLINGETNFLHEDAKYIISFYEGNPIYVQIPQKITLKIIDTFDAVKGDTATNASKEATLETGFKVQVPLFIKNGERIVINTDSGTYFSKE